MLSPKSGAPFRTLRLLRKNYRLALFGEKRAVPLCESRQALRRIAFRRYILIAQGETDYCHRYYKHSNNDNTRFIVEFSFVSHNCPPGLAAPINGFISRESNSAFGLFGIVHYGNASVKPRAVCRQDRHHTEHYFPAVLCKNFFG